ncbi:MAG: DUF1553 domain-containing protein, partial [Planctomycetes bacterium]|nr:DUF1553 domain-containing protein [Planctomycetota bacterium]
PTSFAKWQAVSALQYQDSDWITPDEISITSSHGTAFVEQEDGSFLTSGTNPNNDAWSVSIVTKLPNIRSIRLEALAHPSFAKSGPGRASNGNFALSDFQLTIQPTGSEANSSARPIKLTSAVATFEQKNLPASAAIDDNPQSAWAVDPEFGKDHAILLTTSEPVGDERGMTISISMKFNTNTQHSIGRPRFSVSQKQNLIPSVGSGLRESIRNLLSKPLESLTDLEKSRILKWYAPLDPDWKKLADRRAEHGLTAPKPFIQKVLVATEGLPPVKLHTQAESEFLTETHFLHRGDPNRKESVATQNFLQVLMPNPDATQLFQTPPPPGWRTSYRRTSLTNWLFDLDSGAGSLAARVVTNRVWQKHMGRGIVGTPSDFGKRGDAPSHPELLELLAVELVRHQWDLKWLHRWLLSSSVYRQSSDTDEGRLNIDRDNRLFWHHGRQRLEAEAIRDAITAISGQLDDRMSGPGSLDEKQHRRSMYFTVKRSQLIPTMTVFDAPDGTTPVADRPKTTIAPQSLLLLNNETIRNAARELAAQLDRDQHQSVESLIDRAYRVTIGRLPNSDERTDSIRFLRASEAQGLNGNEKHEKGISIDRLVDFCQVLFCLNEFIFVE